MDSVSAPPKPRRPFRTFVIAAVLFFGVCLVGAGAYWWWINRDIEPTVLTSSELETAEDKLAMAQGNPEARPEPDYQPGGKTVALSEHEINGLINHHTQLGEQLKIELASDAIHARIQTVLDPDFPVMGGKTVKGRARVLAKMIDGQPSLVVDDVTLFGVSLPNAWLADLKGRNLLEDIDAGLGESGLGQGIKSLSVKNGKLVLELND